MKVSKISLAALIGCMILVIGCQASSPRKSIKEFNAAFSTGDEYQNHITVGGKAIPLPEGNWFVASKIARLSETTYIGGGGGIIVDPNPEDSTCQLMLASFSDNELAGIIVINSNLSYKVLSQWRTANPCMKEGKNYLKEISDKDETRECWWFRRLRFNIDDTDSQFFKDGMSYIETRNEHPLPQIVAEVGHYVARDSDFLLISYIWNPKTDERNTYGTEGAGAEYCEKLISWGKSWHPLVVQALESRK